MKFKFVISLSLYLRVVASLFACWAVLIMTFSNGSFYSRLVLVIHLTLWVVPIFLCNFLWHRYTTQIEVDDEVLCYRRICIPVTHLFMISKTFPDNLMFSYVTGEGQTKILRINASLFRLRALKNLIRRLKVVNPKIILDASCERLIADGHCDNPRNTSQ